MGHLGESFVPLLKSVVETTREFIPTDVEDKMRNHQNVIMEGTNLFTTGTSVVFFTVPQNETLYITHFFLECTLQVAGTTSVQSQLEIDGSNEIVALIKLVGTSTTGNVGDSKSYSGDLVMPLQVESGSTLILRKTAEAFAQVRIIGWTEKKGVIPT